MLTQTEIRDFLIFAIANISCNSKIYFLYDENYKDNQYESKLLNYLQKEMNLIKVCEKIATEIVETTEFISEMFKELKQCEDEETNKIDHMSVWEITTLYIPDILKFAGINNYDKVEVCRTEIIDEFFIKCVETKLNMNLENE